MQSREHKLVITEKVLSRITWRDPRRLCMVMLTEAGFSNTSVTPHCWLNELLEAGTEYLMSLAWSEQLLWQEKGLLSSVRALNNGFPWQRDAPPQPLMNCSTPGQSLQATFRAAPFVKCAVSLAEMYLHGVAYKFLPCSLLLCNLGIVLYTESPLCWAGFADMVQAICAAFVSNIYMCQRAKKLLKSKPLS